jgi:tRNA (cmo5U34)-methyltransferase
MSTGAESGANVSEWQTHEHVERYIQRAERLPRSEGEAVLLDELPANLVRVLDLGSGDGRLLARVLERFPEASGVALDFSPSMLDRLRERFSDSGRVRIVSLDLANGLGDIGTFDAVISGFAIHHLEHERKRTLYREVHDLLHPGGVFANLDHVSSPSERLHQRFLDAIGYTPQEEDATNRLLDIETQLDWLREIGYVDVDCYWKWRELALMLGVKSI